jgi:uncharacterized protein
MKEVFQHFRAESGEDEQGVAFYDTPDDAQNLVLRPRETQDNAVPCGNAMAATVLLKLARLNEEREYEKVAQESLAAMAPLMGQYPLGFGQWLVALDAALAVPEEVAVIGDLNAAATRDLVEVAQKGFTPHRLLAAGRGEVPKLLAQRERVDGKVTAYVCRASTCHPPVTDAEALRIQLD